MGWAGPTQPTGPGSAQKCWADFGPKNGLGRSRPKKLISPSGPGPAQKARLGQDPPGPATKTGRGELFPPPPLHAERYSFCMQRRKNKTQGGGGTKVTWRGEAVSGCVAGGAVAEVGGGVLAHGRRLQAAAAVLCFF